jgi:hypothetical protein
VSLGWIVAPPQQAGGFLIAPTLQAAVWEAHQRGWRVWREGRDDDGDRRWSIEPQAMVEDHAARRFVLNLEVIEGYDRASDPPAVGHGVFAVPSAPPVRAPSDTQPAPEPRPAPRPTESRSIDPAPPKAPPAAAQRLLFG